MPTDRYYLDPNGAVTQCMHGRPGDGHHVIGLEHLNTSGIVPEDYADVYRQMFRLRFVRIVEHGPELTAVQQRVVDGFRQAGRRIVQARARFS